MLILTIILGQKHQVTLNSLVAKAHLVEKFGTKGEEQIYLFKGKVFS